MLKSSQMAIEQNLFPFVRSIVQDQPEFPWHRDENNSITADRLVSSQALAIDLFESVNRLTSRDSIVNAWVHDLDLCMDGPWKLTLEKQVAKTLLGEPKPTQIDIMADGSSGIVLFECKFTEPDGGSCSQTKPIRKGLHKGIKQCNGNYELQTNPANHMISRCALSGKNIRYWELINKIINIDPTIDHCPCPFADGWYQWMRNLVAARALGDQNCKSPAFVIVYAEGNFPMAKKLGRPEWMQFLEAINGYSVPLRVVSYQCLLDIAISVATKNEKSLLLDLRAWMIHKIETANSTFGIKRV